MFWIGISQKIPTSTKGEKNRESLFTFQLGSPFLTTFLPKEFKILISPTWNFLLVGFHPKLVRTPGTYLAKDYR